MRSSSLALPLSLPASLRAWLGRPSRLAGAFCLIMVVLVLAVAGSEIEERYRDAIANAGSTTRSKTALLVEHTEHVFCVSGHVRAHRGRPADALKIQFD